MGVPLAGGLPYGVVSLNANAVNPTFAYSAQGVAPVAVNYPLFCLEAGPWKNTRLKRVIIWNPGSQTTAGLVTFSLVRTTTAGSGTTATPASMDNTDAAFTGTLRIPGQTAGTAGTVLYQTQIWVPNAAAASSPYILEFHELFTQKSPTIAAGVTNGIFLRCDTGGAAFASLSFTVEFTEE